MRTDKEYLVLVHGVYLFTIVLLDLYKIICYDGIVAISKRVLWL